MQGCIARPAHRIEKREDAADMIQVEVSDEDFIQLSGVDSQREEISDRPAAYIENKGITVPQLNQITGSPLTNTHRSGSPTAACGDKHLVISKRFFARDVVLWIFFDHRAGFRNDRSLRNGFSGKRQWLAIFGDSRFSGEAVVLGRSVRKIGKYKEGCNAPQQ